MFKRKREKKILSYDGLWFNGFPLEHESADMYEPGYEKTGSWPMRKQRRRSAVQ